MSASPADVDRRWLRHYDPNVPHHLEYPRIPTYRLLDDSASRTPDAPCARFFNRQFTYRQIRDASDRFAAGLQRLGVQRGDRVALLLPNSPQFIVCYYGILKAGAVVVPLNPLYTERELTFHLTDSNAETLVTIPMFLEKAAGLLGHTPLKRIISSPLAEFMPFPLSLVQGMRENRMARRAERREIVPISSLLGQSLPSGWRPAEVSPDEMAVLIYSGGTTGVAKGIMLSHFNLVANAHQLQAWVNLDASGRMLAVIPLFHGFGMSVTMNAPLLAGGEVVLIPRFVARDVLKAIQKTKPTFFIGVPTMFVAFSNVPDVDKYDLRSVKGIFVGAAPLTKGIKDEFEARTGAELIEGYGLTEAVTAIMANPYKGQKKLGSIGLPFPDVDCKIVSLDGTRDLPPGESGEIVLRSPTVMLGYYNKPQETAETIRDGWLFTGDIGHMDEDGYFYITDRKKELIIVGGFNVFPREIDELIALHPKVKEGITVGIPDPVKGERIKVYIVLKEGETATAEEFIAYFRERLVPYKVPSEVEFRSELPKSMIGKILRRKLREEEIARRGGQ
ncbi:MAG: long-chain fatty acid--CoA ligase [Caldilineales bacterium]|nr:long-chain fatty acid--CoA ligase [Caldilineales bacterium]MDW8316765.1 long-chain fatty acid--CoA ligase [Anaerolineae bacterium]